MHKMARFLVWPSQSRLFNSGTKQLLSVRRTINDSMLFGNIKERIPTKATKLKKMAGGKAEYYIQVYEDRMGITAAKQARIEVEKMMKEVDLLIIERRELQKNQEIILSHLQHDMAEVWNTKEKQDLIHQMIQHQMQSKI